MHIEQQEDRNNGLLLNMNKQRACTMDVDTNPAQVQMPQTEYNNVPTPFDVNKSVAGQNSVTSSSKKQHRTGKHSKQ